MIVTEILMQKIKPLRSKGLLLTRFIVPPAQEMTQSLEQWGAVGCMNRAPGCLLEVTVRAIRIKPQQRDD